MNYYTFSYLIFQDGKIRDAGNLLYRNENISTIVDFRKHVAGNHAGPPDTYSAIIIPMWEKITKEAYDIIGKEFEKINEEEMQRINEWGK